MELGRCPLDGPQVRANDGLLPRTVRHSSAGGINRQDERRRSAGLACRRPRTNTRLSGKADRRPPTVELARRTPCRCLISGSELRRGSPFELPRLSLIVHSITSTSVGTRFQQVPVLHFCSRRQDRRPRASPKAHPERASVSSEGAWNSNHRRSMIFMTTYSDILSAMTRGGWIALGM